MLIIWLQNNPNDIQVFELLFTGGPVGMAIMVILFIMFALSIYFIIERYLFIRNNFTFNSKQYYKLKEALSNNSVSDAIEVCENSNSPYARIIASGLKNAHSREEYKSAVEDTAQVEIFQVEKNMNALATIAGAAPMLGFLGTVVGMIIAFHEMAGSETGQINVKQLSEGIYTAMMTTVVGLVVGIFAYLAYNYLVNEVAKISAQIENSALTVYNTLLGKE